MSSDFATNGVVRLAHWGLMRARGTDAASFLHGQLTSDMLKLDIERAVPAGYCSAKGRLQASFVVWRSAADELLLACAADVLAPTLKRLAMFVLRAQCKLSDASAELPLYGLAGDAAASRLGDAPVWAKHDTPEGTLIRLPDAAGVKRALLAAAQAPAGLPEISLDTWRWLEVSSGLPLIEAATVEQFVPQMVNLELVGGVDFRKGCYPGQEVVARSQYRGTLKRRMFLFDVNAPARAGQEIFHSADPGQPAGLVANAAPAPQGGARLLAEVKLAALDAGSLHLGAPDGPRLERRELPYAVPLESASPA